MRQRLQHVARRRATVFQRPVGVGLGHRCVVGTEDADRQRRIGIRRPVRGRVVEHVGQRRIARVARLHGVVATGMPGRRRLCFGGVERVGVGARAGEGQHPVVAVERAGRRHRQRRSTIDVGVGHIGKAERRRRITGMRRTENHVARNAGTIFDRPVGIGLGHRAVVRASNRDCDVLGVNPAVSVIDGHPVDLRQRLACGKKIERAIIDRVGPVYGIACGTRVGHRGRADYQIAQRRRNGIAMAIAHRARNTDGMVVGQIDVGEGHRPRVAQQPAFVRLGFFGHATGDVHRRDHRGIVRARDRDRDVLRICPPMPVIDGHPIDLRQLLASGEEIERAVIDRVRPMEVVARGTRIGHRRRTDA